MRQPHDPSPEYDPTPGPPRTGQETWAKAAPNSQHVQIIRNSKPGLQGMSPRLIQLFEHNRAAKAHSWNPLKKFGIFATNRQPNSNSYLIARKYSGQTGRFITATLLPAGYILALGLGMAVIAAIFTAMLPALAAYRVAIGLLLIFLLALLNLEDSRLSSLKLPEAAYFGLVGLSALGSLLLGYDNALAWILQALLALVLIAAVVIAFAHFQDLINLLVYDRFLPQLFSSATNPRNGYSSAIVLGLFASLSLVVAGGQTANLLPSYAVVIAGVIIMSRTGMLLWESKAKSNGVSWLSNDQLWNNVILAIFSLLLLGLALFFYWPQVWPGLGLILLLGLALKISERYYSQEYEPIPVLNLDKFASAATSARSKDRSEYSIIVPVHRLDKISLATINFAKNLGASVTAILMAGRLAEVEDIFDDWDRSAGGVRLVVLENAFCSPLPALLNYLEKVECNEPGKKLKLVLPQVETRHRWQHLLHDQGFNFFREILLSRKGTEVITVAFRPKGPAKPGN
jgi:hypothetical protein